MSMQQKYLNISNEHLSMNSSELKSILWKIRRRKQIRSRIMLFIITLCLVLGLTVSLSFMVARADTRNNNYYYKYFGSIMVEYGDSLLSIADRYMDNHYDSAEHYIKEIIHINNLRENELKAGQYLVIPYYSDEFIR